VTTRPSRTAALVGLLATAALLAACSSPAATAGPGATVPAGGGATAGAATGAVATAPAGGGTTVDACSLLTNADIKEITGFEVGDVNKHPNDTIFPSACEWKFKDVGWTLDLGITSPGGQAAWDRLVPYAQGKAVTGIGDAAFLTDIAGDLMVRKGDSFFDIQYVAVGGAKDTQDRLAKRVVEHLP
jgi:hypothetical protein